MMEHGREPRERSRHGRRAETSGATAATSSQPEDDETQHQCLDPLNLRGLPDGLTSVEFRPPLACHFRIDR